MAIKNRMKDTPIPVVRQVRPWRVRNTTTMPPGKIVPLAAIPLLREDSCMGRITVGANMAETYEVLMNRMYVRFSAFFVSHAAMERFGGSTDHYERAFAGQPKNDDEGAAVIPYIETAPAPATATPVMKYLGLSAKAGTMINTSYFETYTKCVNYLRRNKSKDLEPIDRLDQTLQPAFWDKSAVSHIVPDFDDGMIAGELPLTVVSALMPVEGIGFSGSITALPSNVAVKESGKTATTVYANSGKAKDDLNLSVRATTGSSATAFPEINARLKENGISVSLANIDQARKLIDWAKMREQYEGISEAWKIDTLMSGFHIDEQAYLQPLLLDTQLVEVRQLKRMAMDGASLEDGAANGVVTGSLSLNLPQQRFGGVIMIMAEAIPEQLFERQPDPWFTAQTVAELPNYKRDVLNPMPVVAVLNGEIDSDHDEPGETFGWARRNWRWADGQARVGGDLYAPDADAATTVARRVIYPTDVENPKLSEEFYVSTTLGRSPFIDQEKDPFLVGIGGELSISGVTVIGEVHESEANYDEMRQSIPPFQPVVKD